MSAASALMLESSPIHGWPATRGDKSEAPATRNVPTAVVFLWTPIPIRAARPEEPADE
jgi:hypothetical protein